MEEETDKFQLQETELQALREKQLIGFKLLDEEREKTNLLSTQNKNLQKVIEDSQIIIDNAVTDNSQLREKAKRDNQLISSLEEGIQRQSILNQSKKKNLSIQQFPAQSYASSFESESLKCSSQLNDNTTTSAPIICSQQGKPISSLPTFSQEAIPRYAQNTLSSVCKSTVGKSMESKSSFVSVNKHYYL